MTGSHASGAGLIPLSRDIVPTLYTKIQGAGSHACPRVLGTPLLSPVSQSWICANRGSKSSLNADFTRENELSVVSPEFKAILVWWQHYLDKWYR